MINESRGEISYKIHCYASKFGPNQNRDLGEVIFNFIPRIGDYIIFNTKHPGYDDKVMGRVIRVRIDITEDGEITCLFDDVGSV